MIALKLNQYKHWTPHYWYTDDAFGTSEDFTTTQFNDIDGFQYMHSGEEYKETFSTGMAFTSQRFSDAFKSTNYPLTVQMNQPNYFNAGWSTLPLTEGYINKTLKQGLPTILMQLPEVAGTGPEFVMSGRLDFLCTYTAEWELIDGEGYTNREPSKQKIRSSILIKAT
eukprot:GHVS01013931.1.p1 GENE.GHVS01013931.1~~GHVS01013931.1.p1  ORF type:complete len:196 (+),score=8.52 GHVS01013931.1:87-590(+)